MEDPELARHFLDQDSQKQALECEFRRSFGHTVVIPWKRSEWQARQRASPLIPQSLSCHRICIKSEELIVVSGPSIDKPPSSEGPRS